MKIHEMSVYKDAIELARMYRSFFSIMSQADQFSIGSQMLRSSVSIASNIAEGFGRKTTDKALLQFLGYSLGSLFEFRAQLDIIGIDYGNYHAEKENMWVKIALIEKGMSKLINHIKKSEK